MSHDIAGYRMCICARPSACRLLNGGNYSVTISANTVSVYPNSSNRHCGSTLEFLRQSESDGSVVTIGNSWATGRDCAGVATRTVRCASLARTPPEEPASPPTPASRPAEFPLFAAVEPPEPQPIVVNTNAAPTEILAMSIRGILRILSS